MNLKLKRLVRTPSSEQYALFDLDQVDADGLPMTIGKLDLHYTGEGMYGTILLWDEASRRLTVTQRSGFIRALLNEITQPMGVPSEFVVEFFAPTLADYEVFHNLGGQEGGGLTGADSAEGRRRTGDVPAARPGTPG
ncbi:MAG: hypothetical protein IPK16_21320 [Anaerolineales bacterium]|nr:hypothetical protein [Anaerolineales bacterium]